jgi:DNA-binding transcriptional LysR family regulator
MKLHYLKYFCVLAEELHFHRAADRLAISQPPLSAAIKSLEDELGVQLMRRNSKMVELTRAGHAFLAEARAILERVGRAGDLVRALGQGMQGRLLVGISGSLLYREVASIIAEFQANRPMVEVVLHELSAVEQIDKLTHGQLDVAFVHGSKAPLKLKSIPLQNDVFVLCLPERHPLAARSEVDLREVGDESFVMFSREAAPSNHDNVIAIFSNAGVHPRTVHMARTWMTIISTVAQVGGVAIVPKSMEKAQIAGVRYVPLTSISPISPAMLIWNPEASSAELEKFLEGAMRITDATAS